MPAALDRCGPQVCQQGGQALIGPVEAAAQILDGGSRVREARLSESRLGPPVGRSTPRFGWRVMRLANRALSRGAMRAHNRRVDAVKLRWVYLPTSGQFVARGGDPARLDQSAGSWTCCARRRGWLRTGLGGHSALIPWDVK